MHWELYFFVPNNTAAKTIQIFFFSPYNHSDFSFPTISYISHLGFNKMWHTHEVFHDHPKHPQNLHASTINLTLLLIVITVIRLLGITLRAIARSPIPLPSWVLCTRSVTTEQYHLYKSCIYSYAIVYSCIPKGNEFTTDISRCRHLYLSSGLGTMWRIIQTCKAKIALLILTYSLLSLKKQELFQDNLAWTLL